MYSLIVASGGLSPMSRIYTTIHIRRPVEQVFDYVTAPANWPKWHP